MMGTGVGLTIGFIFGSWTIIRCVSSCLRGSRRLLSEYSNLSGLATLLFTERSYFVVVALDQEAHCRLCRNTC